MELAKKLVMGGCSGYFNFFVFIERCSFSNAYQGTDRRAFARTFDSYFWSVSNGALPTSVP